VPTFVRVGRRVVNLDFMVEADRPPDRPGVVRLTLLHGAVREFDGPDAARLIERLDALDPDPGEADEDVSGEVVIRSLPPSAEPKQRRGG
jgi:hypothetical protein